MAQRKLDYKVEFLRIALWLVVLTAGLLGVYRLFVTPLLAVVNFAIVLACFASLLLLKQWPHKVEVIADLALGMVFMGASVVYLFHTDNSIRLGMFFPFVAGAFYLKGGRGGVYWLLAAVSIILAGYLLPWFSGGYALIEIVAGCLYLAILFAVLVNFEKMHTEQLQRDCNYTVQSLVDARWRVALEGVGDAIWDWDIQNDHFIASKSYAEMLGYAEAEIGDTMVQQKELLHPEDRARVANYLAQYLAGDGSEPFVSEQRMRCKDGTYKWVLCRGRVTQRNTEGRPQRVVGTHVDITEQKEQERQLEQIAHFDVLTGAPNRGLLADRLSQALARTKRERELLAVCYLDLDGFKPVNDKYGHQIGDQVLVEVTRRIKETIREDDTVARLGGDEFALLLVGLQVPEECVGSLQRLLETLNQPILLPGISIRISASIGVALYPQDEENAETLLRHADQAMYIAKQAGRNRYHLFDAAHDRRARSHHDLLRGIRRGLARGEFELYYQPKVDLAKRRMVGAEALLRWHHPQRGLLRPDEFLRVIENTELEIELGDWVIGSALAQLCRWRAEGEEFEEFEVSINISAYHLRSADFVHKMQSAMQGCCARACRGCLQIEVLESVALEDIAHVSPIINACREFGVGFVLDDFGTGYSPLTCLSDLAVDGLKIDQSFVRGMLYDRGARAIVQGIIALAQAFERGVVAEGAEQTEQLRVLQEMGCPVVQGNVIALPMPAAELAEWCRREWPPKAD